MSSESSKETFICRICSDKAIGYNFNALTCEPCKAFFRRTSDKLESLQCPFTNDCEIDVRTRKMCRKCRLMKCFKVGMKKDWLNTKNKKKPRKSVHSRHRPPYCHLYHPKHLQSSTSQSDNLCTGSNFNCQPSTLLNSSHSLPLTSPSTAGQFFQNDTSYGVSKESSYFPLNSAFINTASLPGSRGYAHGIPSYSEDKITMLNGSAQSQQLPYYNYLQNNESPLAPFARFSDPAWLVKFLVESHSINNIVYSRRTHYHPNSYLMNSFCDFNKVNSTLASKPNPHNNQKAISISKAEKSSNQTGVRVNVIVDGRKLSAKQRKHSETTATVTSSAKSDDRSSSPDNFSMKNRVIRKILDAEFAPLHLFIDSQKPSHDKLVLNNLETAAINNLCDAFIDLNTPAYPYKGLIEDVLAGADAYIKQIIAGIRYISGYAKLNLADQIALIKSSYVNMVLVKGIFNYNPKTQICQITENTNQALEEMDENFFKIYQKWAENLNQECKKDEKICYIMMTIVLFNLDLHNLQDYEIVKVEHYTYIYLLKRYLESKYNSICRAQTEHFNLIMTIETIKETVENKIKLKPSTFAQSTITSQTVQSNEQQINQPTASSSNQTNCSTNEQRC